MMGFRQKQAHPGEISIGDHPTLTADYFELARFWVSPTKMRSYVMTGFEEQWEPELLGSLLVESLYTAAAAYAARREISKEDALQRLWQGLDDERARLASEPLEENY